METWNDVLLVAEEELVAEECDAEGLPRRLNALLRHIRNNHAAIIGFKDVSIKRLTQKLDQRVSNAGAVVNDSPIDIHSPTE